MVGWPRPDQEASIFGIGGIEVLLIVTLVLILFGPQRMHEIVRTLAQVTREVRRVMSDVREEIEEAVREEPPPNDPKKP